MKAAPNTIDQSIPQKALIFIPDISGFTKFVTDTEVSHAQHIIQELLELLIDSNKIGLELSEIEGDAILFYRFGKAPNVGEMTQQVKEMFSKFHMHLKKYERNRICNCGACCTASKLAIKFIGHYGDISVNQIRQYQKLFGKEVIVAHRLLKNEIPSDEYSLFTDDLRQSCPSWESIDEASWAPVLFDEQEYDSGKVRFCYLSLEPLFNELKEPDPVDYSLGQNTSQVIESEILIDAPMETVFNVMADVPWRAKWLPGVLAEFTDINSMLTQSGQTHKCLANGPILISHDYSITDHTITFSETMADKKYSVVFRLKKVEEKKTLLQVTGFIRKSLFIGLIFKLVMKPKLIKVYNQAWNNLKNYIDDLKEKGIEHPYKIQLTPALVSETAQ